MHSSYTFTVGSAVFDEQNLVSSAGLVPVLELAEQTSLSPLIREHVHLPSTRVKSGAVNPVGKLTSIIAAMTCGADSIDDARRAARQRHTTSVQRGVCALDAGDLLARVHLRACQPARRGGPRASGRARPTDTASARQRRTRVRRHRLAVASGLWAPQAGRLVRARQDRQSRAAAFGPLTADHHYLDSARGAGHRRGAATQRAGRLRARGRPARSSKPSAPPARARRARSWCAAIRRSAPRR